MHFDAIVPDICYLENRRTLQPDDFPAVLNYGKLPAKFLVSSTMVIDRVGCLWLFQNFTRTTMKIPLKY